LAEKVKGAVWMTKSRKLITCDICTEMPCRESYPDGIPPYCPAGRYGEVLEKAKAEYLKPEITRLFVASRKITKKGYGKWPRIKEAIEYARELGLKKVGLATCIGTIRETRQIAQLFRGAGFDVLSVGCHIGGVHEKEHLVPEEYWGKSATTCNPIAQARILNQYGTEMNFTVGLCVGHDALFNKYAEAPVVNLLVKDRVTAHNPAAALYCRYLWEPLREEY
jgi:uncharacterized metal-binding protein